ncbi:winged helix-turn-helix transcriptional regulator [Methanohalophilus sp. RSK]|uniref:winged helix-turn-helix transcriptional regulator n=1 Tax=Methanohalophilus sp. RSK TaxID=2485783 RepID=UPI000F43B54B|nr:winged helix-turn-helix transcriptional regulator [Methanohalophilus sp. RSK]RNI14135.1 winged helix-turn-helix transcriptional regulator [Methanohalophilus sp. RSK]
MTVPTESLTEELTWILGIQAELSKASGGPRFNHKITLLKTTKSVLFFKNSYQYTDAEKKIVFCLRNDTRKSILHSILRKPGITNKDITEAFHLDKSTVRWHINELHNEELVHFNSDGKYKRCFINPAIEADVERVISESGPAISAN